MVQVIRVLGWSKWSRWSLLSKCSVWSGWSASTVCIQKIYGFHYINHQNIEKSWDATSVTEDGVQRKIEQYSDRPETAKHGYKKNHFQPSSSLQLYRRTSCTEGEGVYYLSSPSWLSNIHERKYLLENSVLEGNLLFCLFGLAGSDLQLNPWQNQDSLTARPPLLKNVNNCLPGDNPRHGGRSVRMSLAKSLFPVVALISSKWCQNNMLINVVVINKSMFTLRIKRQFWFGCIIIIYFNGRYFL